MFAPSRDEVRKFFVDTWIKQRARALLSPMESMAAEIILAHPEYQQLLSAGDPAAKEEFTVEQDGINPFLHMSLHLAIEEQLSIDQPRGLRQAFERILAKCGDRHTALHAVLECLGETVWRAQREGKPLDAEAYLDCVRKR